MKRAFITVNAAGIIALVFVFDTWMHRIDVAESHARPACQQYFDEINKGSGA